jgi:hypothetical protein
MKAGNAFLVQNSDRFNIKASGTFSLQLSLRFQLLTYSDIELFVIRLPLVNINSLCILCLY